MRAQLKSLVRREDSKFYTPLLVLKSSHFTTINTQTIISKFLALRSCSAFYPAQETMLLTPTLLSTFIPTYRSTIFVASMRPAFPISLQSRLPKDSTTTPRFFQTVSRYPTRMPLDCIITCSTWTVDLALSGAVIDPHDYSRRGQAGRRRSSVLKQLTTPWWFSHVDCQEFHVGRKDGAQNV